MKKLCLILMLILAFCACGKEPENEIPSEEQEPSFSENSANEEEKPAEKGEDVIYLGGWTADFKPSDFETMEEYEKAFLDEYVKQLEPIEFFETEKEFPAVILEIFDLIMEKEPYEFLKSKNLLGIEVFGDQKEFYVSYQYITNEDAEEYLNIRVRKNEKGKFGLLLRGGGAPGGHGLEKTDITIEDML